MDGLLILVRGGFDGKWGWFWDKIQGQFLQEPKTIWEPFVMKKRGSWEGFQQLGVDDFKQIVVYLCDVQIYFSFLQHA